MSSTVDEAPDSPFFALAPLDPEWRPILHAENQVVLYNPTSHALSIQQHGSTSTSTHVVSRYPDGRCPYCHQSLSGSENLNETDDDELEAALEEESHIQSRRSRVPNYFQLLQIANETGSVPSTPASSRQSRTPTMTSQAGSENSGSERPFRAENMAEGYFKAFFREECRLGMGANGSVYLCQHMLDGNSLGRFAVKKVAVGQSHTYLLNILREVRLLEKLHHPNIVTYHHAWLETCQFSSFGPKIPTLHILMQWAEGGSLDDFIDVRVGRTSVNNLPHLRLSSTQPIPQDQTNNAQATFTPPETDAQFSRGARIRAFRALQHAPPEERERLRREMAGMGIRGNPRMEADWKAVHLLSAEEVKSLFQDVVEGLAFLHDKSILHLDLKPGNVLLTYDEGKLIPRAMLSDFGTSQDMLNLRQRSGNTGTLEYASPESLPSPTGLLNQIDSKSDMWSLGMILHKLLFFRLPYRNSSDNLHKNDEQSRGTATVPDLLEQEVSNYPGFKSSQALISAFESRHLPRAFLLLLENLLHVRPASRPSCERVLSAIREGRLDPVVPSTPTSNGLKTSLIPLSRRSDDEQSFASSSQEQPSPSTSNIQEVELPLLSGSASNHSIAAGDDKYDTDIGSPYLGLPAPPRQRPAPMLKLRLWKKEFVVEGLPPRTLLLRSVKSILLVWKVWTIFSKTQQPFSSPRLLTCALGLAIFDTLSDTLLTSIILGLAHVGLVYLASPTYH